MRESRLRGSRLREVKGEGSRRDGPGLEGQE